MKKFPSPSDNQSRIASGVSESYPSAGRGPSQPNRNTNTNTPVKHLPAVQFGDMHAVADKMVGASAKPPAKPFNVARRAPGNASPSQPMPPVRGTAAANPVGSVKNPKPARK